MQKEPKAKAPLVSVGGSMKVELAGPTHALSSTNVANVKVIIKLRIAHPLTPNRMRSPAHYLGLRRFMKHVYLC